MALGRRLPRSSGSPPSPLTLRSASCWSPIHLYSSPCGLTVFPRDQTRRPGQYPDVRVGVCSHRGVPSCPGGPAVLPLVAGVHLVAPGAQDAGQQVTNTLAPSLLGAVSGGSQASRVHTGPVVSSSRVQSSPALGHQAPAGGGGWRRLFCPCPRPLA